MLGYNIPTKILSKISMSNLRFYASAENLFTITQYPGLDPEKKNSSRDLYPINRSFSLGINVSFLNNKNMEKNKFKNSNNRLHGHWSPFDVFIVY